ncbi:MAG: ABC transporter permease [Oscillospiraceae bacterium]|nr:ABC transporter permease [Oscillospiraceae bacterium]
MKSRVKLSDLVPFIAFVVLFVFFSIGTKGKMLSSYSLKMLIEQSILTIISGCGVLFVVAQGSIDLTVGVNVALSGVVAMHVAHVTGQGWLMVPVALAVGLAMGLFNGFIVSKCHVPSFTLSIAMLIGVRGVVNFIQTKIGVEYVPQSMLFMTSSAFRIGAFFVIAIIMAYLFEFTKLGRYSRAIGENETTARFVGVPVDRMKIAVFALSGLMAGFGALFSMATVGGTTQTMGVFLEMKVAMGVFFGGVLVTGGSSAKFYKIILGALSITIIVYGLSLMGMSDSHISQSVEGGLLLVILFLTILANRKKTRLEVLHDGPHDVPKSPDAPQAPEAPQA